ncbi:hypothetical protein J4462_03390 [Candidatus Pacearchaeota archaeon]|nr:hypothetical protein [Candidatus Pacearchaeota archaeon]
MRKIIFGIVIPLIVIVVLAILGSVETGFSVDNNYLKEISVKEAFSDIALPTLPKSVNSDRALPALPESVKIGEIKIKNDYFLARRHNLPNLGACLVDEEWALRPLDAGNIRYSEGDFSPDSEFYSDYGNERSVEVGAYSEEEVRIYVEPSYIFQRQNYSELVEAYRNYDNLVVYEREKNGRYYYDQCGSLDEDILEEGVKIDLVF